MLGRRRERGSQRERQGALKPLRDPAPRAPCSDRREPRSRRSRAPRPPEPYFAATIRSSTFRA